MIRSVAVLIFAFAAVSGCDDKNGQVISPQPTPTPTGSSSVTSIGQAITASIADGSLPTLDVSTSVAGPDANSNGIRDDIDRYINALGDSDVEKAALRQQAAALQSSLVMTATDADTVAGQAQKMTAAVQCIYSRYPEATASAKVSDLEKYTVNTKERFLAYGRYNSAVSGNVTLSVEGTGCGQ